MSFDWHNHPLHAEVSVDGEIHILYQTLKAGMTPLGIVRLDTISSTYQFFPQFDMVFSGTQLWQVMCYVVDLNQTLNPNDEPL